MGRQDDQKQIANARAFIKTDKKNKQGIQRRIQAAFARYAGSLPPHFMVYPDGLKAKIICEGGIDVTLGLLEEACEEGNAQMVHAVLESLNGARERLQGLDLNDDSYRDPMEAING